MATQSEIDLNDLNSLLAEGVAAGRDANPSAFQLRVLAACLAGEWPDSAFCVATGDIKAERREGGWLLSGSAPAALSTVNAATQCTVLAASEEGLLSFRLPVDAPGLVVAAASSIDLLPACDVTFDKVHATQTSLLRHIDAEALAPALFVLCAEMTGSSAAALDIALDRARSRKVFGRAIGAYQALAHRLVDARIDLEAMQLALDEMVQAGPDTRALHAIALKVLCASAGPRIVATCQQVHGGEGFYADQPLQRYTRRVQGLVIRLGALSRHLTDLAARIARSR